MRSLLRALAGLLLAALIPLAATSSAFAAGGELSGTWTSTDTDGSSQTLEVRGSGAHVYAMSLVDDAASACDGNPAGVVGSGVVDGDTVLMTATLTCQPGGNIFRGRLFIEFVYDAQTDTLTDFFGVTWYRG